MVNKIAHAPRLTAGQIKELVRRKSETGKQWNPKRYRLNRGVLGRLQKLHCKHVLKHRFHVSNTDYVPIHTIVGTL